MGKVLKKQLIQAICDQRLNGSIINVDHVKNNK